MAVRQQFVIPRVTHDFEVVTGIVISDSLGFFAYNSNSSFSMWVISDIKSGLLVACKLRTLADCKAWVENIPQETLDKINKVRSGAEYRNMCDIIRQKALEMNINNKCYESFSFDEAFSALDSLNFEGNRQARLLKLSEWLSGYGKLCESVRIDFANEVAKLIKKYPDRFSDIDAENLAKPKQISIDYLDGCTDITFNAGLGNDDPIADLTGNSTNILALDEYEDLMQEVFKGKVDKWLEEHNLSHEDICWLTYDPDEDKVFIEFNTPSIHENESTVEDLKKQQSLSESKLDWEKFEAHVGKELADRFKMAKDRLVGEERDIYYWMKQPKPAEALEARLKKLSSIPTNAERDAVAASGAEKVFEDDNWIVLLVRTVDAARKYGKTTSWCISAENVSADGQTAESHWHDYIDRGAERFYFVLSKHNDREKYCVVHYSNKPREFWDAADTVVLGIPNGPAYEPVELPDNEVPSYIRDSAYIVAQYIINMLESNRRTKTLRALREPGSFSKWFALKLACMNATGGIYGDAAMRYFAKLAKEFKQFGGFDRLFDIYSSSRERREQIVAEVGAQIRDILNPKK